MISNKKLRFFGGIDLSTGPLQSIKLGPSGTLGRQLSYWEAEGGNDLLVTMLSTVKKYRKPLKSAQSYIGFSMLRGSLAESASSELNSCRSNVEDSYLMKDEQTTF